MLRTLVLRGGNNPSGEVRNAHGSFDLVHVLPTFAARAVGVNFEFSGRDDNLGRRFLDFGDGIDTGEAGVAAFV